jgi:hypothetical protein
MFTKHASWKWMWSVGAVSTLTETVVGAAMRGAGSRLPDLKAAAGCAQSKVRSAQRVQKDAMRAPGREVDRGKEFRGVRVVDRPPDRCLG